MTLLGALVVLLHLRRRNLDFWNRIELNLEAIIIMVSIDDLGVVVHGLFNELIVGPLKSKMAEIRHLENQYYVIFLPWAV